MPNVSPAESPVNREPPYEVLADADDDHDAWMEARRGIITASEVAAIMGIVPGMSRLFYEARDMLVRAPPEGFGAEAMEFGHLSEDFNAQLFQRKTGRRVRRVQKLLRSKDFPWLGATLDYEQWLEGDPQDDEHAAPLELKSTGQKMRWPEDDEPDLRYQAQLQAQMLVVDQWWGSLSAIIGSPVMHHRYLDFEAHEAFQDRLLDRTERFWKALRRGDVEPPWEEHSHDHADALRKLTIDYLSGELVQLSDDAQEDHDELQLLDAQLKVLNARRNELRDNLRIAMGHSTRGLLPCGGEYTFEPRQRAGYTVQPAMVRKLEYKPSDNELGADDHYTLQVNGITVTGPRHALAATGFGAFVQENE